MVTYYVMKMTTICSPIIGECFDTMIVASSDKEWLQWPIEILVLETVLSHLKSQHDELQAQKCHFCAHSNTQSLVMGLRKVPDLVFTCATCSPSSVIRYPCSGRSPILSPVATNISVSSHPRLEPGLQHQHLLKESSRVRDPFRQVETPNKFHSRTTEVITFSWDSTDFK